jgi:hypothetical protein
MLSGMRRGPLAGGWGRSRGWLVIGVFGVSVLLGGVVAARAFTSERTGLSLIAGHRSHLSIPNDDLAYLYAADPSAGLAQGVDKRPKSLRVARAALAGGLALVGPSVFALFRLRPARWGRSSVPARRQAPRAPPLLLPI